MRAVIVPEILDDNTKTSEVPKVPTIAHVGDTFVLEHHTTPFGSITLYSSIIIAALVYGDCMHLDTINTLYYTPLDNVFGT